jgi:hypothetical protein
MSDHILTNDGMGLRVPHGYRLLDRSKLPTTSGMTLFGLMPKDLERIGLERVCDPAQEGNLFGEVEK